MLEGGGWGLSDNKGKEAIFGGIEQERWARKEVQIRKSILLHIIQFNHLNISKTTVHICNLACCSATSTRLDTNNHTVQTVQQRSKRITSAIRTIFPAYLSLHWSSIRRSILPAVLKISRCSTCPQRIEEAFSPSL